MSVGGREGTCLSDCCCSARVSVQRMAVGADHRFACWISFNLQKSVLVRTPVTTAFGKFGFRLFAGYAYGAGPMVAWGFGGNQTSMKPLSL
eukprot:2117165-Prymnesium_polylepis.1